MNPLQSFIFIIYVVSIILVINVKASSEYSDSDFTIDSDESISGIGRKSRRVSVQLGLKGSVRRLFALEAFASAPGNVVCSPVSAMLPLAKLAIGAQGKCQNELLVAIGIKGHHKIDAIKAEYTDMIRQLERLPGVELTVSSKIFVSDKYRVNNFFKKTADQIFNSAVELINFDHTNLASQKITDWMRKESPMASNFFYNVQGKPVSIIINVVTFLGDWDKKFHKVRNEDFYSPNGAKTVSMMSRSDLYDYAASDDLQAQLIKIPYKREKTFLIVVLPYTRTGLPALLETLKINPDMLNDALKKVKPEAVILSLPKFKIISELNLIKLYNNIGVHSIFQGKSGLTGIVENVELTVSYAAQLTAIDVNQQGTEAVAAAVLDLVPVSQGYWVNQAVFHANHPFLFYVNCAKEQLFAGVYRGNYTHHADDILHSENKNEDTELEYLPPVFTSHDDSDENDDDDNPYPDYEYDFKELNYKDSPDSATAKSTHDGSVDDKIPLHTAKDNLPIFLLEPENTYVVKNKPALLKCRAANALEIYFKCNGIKIQAINFEFVDPQTGVRIIEGEHKVTRETVEEYFGSDKYQCSCFAWTSRGHIRSQPATIEIAYIKKHFSVAPQSQLVRQNTPITFRCEPPPAAPFAQLYWLKNGAPVVFDDNVQISNDGNLVIKQTSLLDMANYTCVAENLAGKRISEPALLTVFVNGGWSAWSAWSECDCGSSRVGRRRVRTCSAPRPLNGGQPCMGPDVQKTQDCVDCDLDLYVDGLDELADESSGIVLGRWSQWSEWSLCDTDCLQTRRRRCVTSTACLGKDYQVAQCPLCVRTSKSEMLHNGSSSYWPLFIALSIAFLIFIVVIVLGIKYMKFKMTENSPYAKPPSGSNYFGNVIRRTLTNQPDLTIHEEFHTVDSRRTHRHRSTSTNTRHEHLYEIPQLANSYIAPLDLEVRTGGNDRNACVDSQLDRSDSSCFMSSGSSYGNNSVEMSPSLKNNASLDSKYSNGNLETAASRIVGSEGSWLKLDKCGVSLYIPDGVVDKGEELFTLEVVDEEWNRPVLKEGETQLSPIVRCGPKNFHFRKGVVVSFPHCTSLKSTSWLLSILQKPDEINKGEWRKVLTLGQETPGTPIFAQLDPAKVYLVCEFLSDFVLVGRSFSGLDAKLLKLALFMSKGMNDSYSLKIHVFNDTPYAFYDCFESERRCGGYLLCDPKTISFQENCSDLCFNIRDVGVGWKVQSGGKYQELPYSQLWNMNVRSLHCAVALEQTDGINCFELNMSVYQKQKQSNQVNFNLKTNDLNSNLSSKRFSCSSADAINILENPFNYSSLTKKEGRYDFVYKNNSFRSNFSVDNNYRYNVLTKSDRVILCKLLDSQTAKGNDWRLFAEKLNISSYYYYFSNTCSPTENILNLWLCRNNDVNMLVNLARIFREMGRVDCATVVERRCFTN